MSRAFIACLSPLLLPVTLAAQAPPPEGVQIYPASGFGATAGANGSSVVTRLSWPTGTTFPSSGSAELLAQYPKSHFEGIGDYSTAGNQNNPTCRVANWSIYLQDQNMSTAHQFSAVMRPGTSAGAPDTTKTLYLANFSTPTLTTSGAGTWRLWLVSPINTAIPCTGDLFFGLKLNANSNWPSTDGISVQTAFYDPKATMSSAYGNPTTVANGDAVPPRANVPNLTWGIYTDSQNNPVAVQPPIWQVLNYVLITDNASLQVGVRHKTGQSNHATDDGFGAAALYPSISGGSTGRQDGLLVRITDNRAATTPYVLAISVTKRPIPLVQIAGWSGSLYVFNPVLYWFGNTTASQQTVVPLVPPALLTSAEVGITVYFQALVGTQLTNLAAVTY